MRVRSTREQIWRLSINELLDCRNCYSRKIVKDVAHRQVFTKTGNQQRDSDLNLILVNM